MNRALCLFFFGFAVATTTACASSVSDAPTAAPDGRTSVRDGDAAAPVVTCDAGLTSDPKNCGACGHDCLGGECVAGVCERVQFGEEIPESSSRTIACDGDDVFVGNEIYGQGGRFYKVERTGPPVPVVEWRDGTGSPYLSATHLYWVEGHHALYRTSRSSPGVVEKVTPGIDTKASVSNIVGDARGTFFATSPADDSVTTVYRIPPDGGPAVAIGSSEGLDVGPLANVGAIALGPTDVFVTTWVQGGSVWKLPLSGAKPSVVVRNFRNDRQLASVGNRLFVLGSSEEDTLGYRLLEISTGALVDVAGMQDVEILRGDRDGLFWTGYPDKANEGMRIRRTVGAAFTTTIVTDFTTATDPEMVYDFALDRRSICMLAGSPTSKKVYRIAKPLP